MLRCSRFLPALLFAFLYALVVPICIRVRMGGAGWHWIWNEPAFGFFMVAVFPFAAAVFSCVVDVDLLRSAVTSLSKLTIPVLLFGAMLVLLVPGVQSDFGDSNRLRPPYQFKNPSNVQELSTLHDRIFEARDFVEGRQLYKNKIAGLPLSPTMKIVFMASNFINVGFAAAVFCYILLLAVVPPGIEEKVCNHLVFVLATMATWFPCRAYAEWYLNLNDMAWLNTYQAAWVLAVLLVVACVVLGLKMVSGSLYHRFVIPVGVISAIGLVLAKFESPLLSRAALDLASFNWIFMSALALIVVALIFYVSSSIHQQRQGG